MAMTAEHGLPSRAEEALCMQASQYKRNLAHMSINTPWAAAMMACVP